MSSLRALPALLLASALAACGGALPINEGGSCDTDLQCASGQLCLAAGCAAEGTTSAASLLALSPTSATLAVSAGQSPPATWLTVANGTSAAHAFEVLCDQGATPSESSGVLAAGAQLAISIALQAPAAAGATTHSCSVASSSGHTVFGRFQLTLEASAPGGGGAPDGGGSTSDGGGNPSDGGGAWDGGSENDGGSSGPTADFSLSLAPGSLTLSGGGSATASVGITPSGAFDAATSLFVSGVPAGASASFDTSVIAAGSGSATLSVSAGSAAAGSYSLVITAAGGGLSHQLSLPVTIGAAADFSLALAGISLVVAHGGSSTLSAALAGVDGFSADIALSVSGLPLGATASFSPATISGGSGGSTLTVNAGSASGGSSTVTVTARSGALSHSESFALTITAIAGVPDFGLTATPSAVLLSSGGAAGTVAVRISALNGYQATTALTVTGAPSGVSATLDQTVLQGGGGTATLTIDQGSQAPGSWTLTVTASGAGLVHTAQIALTIAGQQGDFGISIAPGSYTMPWSQHVGDVGVNITSLRGFVGDVQLTTTGAPDGITPYFQDGDDTVPGGSGQAVLLLFPTLEVVGSFTLTVTGVSGALTHSASFVLNVTSPYPGTFSLSLSPAKVTLPYGSAVDAVSVSCAAAGGFDQDVQVDVTGLPAGLTINSGSGVLSGCTGTVALNIGAVNVVSGTYTIVVSGSAASGGQTASTNLTVVIQDPTTPDFSLSVSPSPVSMPVYSNNYTATLTVKPLRNFYGYISLSTEGPFPNGEVDLSNNGGIDAGDNTNTMTFITFSTAPGTYPMLITATGTDQDTGLQLTHTLSVQVIVTGF